MTINVNEDELFIGSEAKIQTAIKDADGNLVNPSGDITFSTIDPEGTLTTKTQSDPEVTNISPGVYKYVFITNLAERWFCRVTSSGDVITAIEGEFTVNKSNFV